MSAIHFAPALLAAALTCCSSTRKQECDRFLAAIKPIEHGTPSAALVDGVEHSIAIDYQDQPLREYAFSTQKTLTSLANSLRLQASPSPPDGADELVKAKLNEALGEVDDVTRYCAE